MTHLPELRRQLLAAAAREYEPAAQPRHGGMRRILGVVPAGVALAVAAVVLVLVHHGPGGGQTAPVPGAVQPSAQLAASRRALITELAVLRRPQTARDRAFARSFRRQDSPFMRAAEGEPDMSLIRYATTTPWGERIYLVPLIPLTRPQLAKLRHAVPGLPPPSARQALQERLAEYSSSDGGGGASDAAMIRSGGLFGSEGAGRSFAGGSTKTRLILVVPDGVATVTFVVPRRADGPGYGAPTYRHAERVTAIVHGNVAAVEVNRDIQAPPPMIWRAASGRVLKQVDSTGPGAARRPQP